MAETLCVAFQSFGCECSTVFASQMLASSRLVNIASIKYEDGEATSTQLANEKRIYLVLEGGVGIPRVLWFGTRLGRSALVTSLLGRSLKDFFNLCGRKFSLKTVLMLADQLLTRLEYIHGKGFIHRNLELVNIVIGRRGDGNLVHIIDYLRAGQSLPQPGHEQAPLMDDMLAIEWYALFCQRRRTFRPR